MAGRELANFKRACFVRKVIAQIGFERSYVEFFAGANRCRLVEEIAHWKISLATRAHCEIDDVLVNIETAEREALGVVKKFAPGCIARHPRHLQCAFRREVQRTLRADSDGAARSENRDPFAARSSTDEFVQAGIYAGAELQPRLDAFQLDYAANPITDDRFEQSLKGHAFLGVSDGGLERGMEVADSLIFFHQCGKAAAEHGFALIFIEFRQHYRLGKMQASFLVRSAHKSHGVLLPCAWADADTVECDSTPRPVFAENASLRFAERGQFVIVRLEERCLGVTYEIEDAHRQVGRSLKVGSPA